jgi:hypothetical protein
MTNHPLPRNVMIAEIKKYAVALKELSDSYGKCALDAHKFDDKTLLALYEISQSTNALHNELASGLFDDQD